MEQVPQKAYQQPGSEFPPFPQPELQIVPTPEPEIEKNKISPDQLDDLIKHPEKQWDKDDSRNKKDKPTLH